MIFRDINEKNKTYNNHINVTNNTFKLFLKLARQSTIDEKQWQKKAKWNR